MAAPRKTGPETPENASSYPDTPEGALTLYDASTGLADYDYSGHEV